MWLQVCNSRVQCARMSSRAALATSDVIRKSAIMTCVSGVLSLGKLGQEHLMFKLCHATMATNWSMLLTL